MGDKYSLAMIETTAGESHQHNATLERRMAEKSLLRKLDILILPLLSLSYLLAYMDRNNIGYARLMGLEKDLDISDSQFYNVIMIFYAGYLTCILPANLLLRKLGPKLQLGFSVVAFGVFVCAFCAAQGYADLLGLRFAIGAAEALLQSAPLYMVVWYGRDELGKRIAFFYSATTISGVFSGLISYGVQKDLDGVGGRPSWQWLFIIEGSAAIGIGLLNGILLPSFPRRQANIRFFTSAEIEIAVERSSAHNSERPSFQLAQTLASVKDPKTWLLALLAGCNSTLLASTGAFLPTIIREFGFSKVRTQLFTVIPYAFAFVSMIAVGYLSDRLRTKSVFILGSLSSCLIGLIILITTAGRVAGMVGTTLLVSGAYPAAVLQIAWIQITFCGSTKRATSWAIAMLFGQGLSMSGAQIYRNAPRFFLGHGVLIGFVCMGLICTCVARIIMLRDNKTRDESIEKYRNEGQSHPDAELDFEDVCDKHVNFRYII